MPVKKFIIGTIYLSLSLSFSDIRKRNYFLIASSCIGFIIAWLTRDNYQQSNLLTILIWQLQAVGVIFTVLITHILLQEHLFAHLRNNWVKLFVSALIGSAIYSPIGLFIDVFLAGENIPNEITKELFDEFMGYAPPTVFIWIALNVPWLLGYKLYRPTDNVTNLSQGVTEEKTTKANIKKVTGSAAPKLNALFELMPISIGKDIVYIQSELHYLKVVTVLGECMVLFSLKEASTLLPNDSGFMCHRSYWISKTHIKKFKQIGRVGNITMSNDADIPVSKRKLSDFKKWAEGADWLS